MLRHDNADARLTPLGRELGIVDDVRWARFEQKQTAVESGLQALRETYITAPSNPKLEAMEETPVKDRASLFDLMRRPEMTLDRLARIASACGIALELPEDPAAREGLEIAAMYDGYLRQAERVREQSRKLEDLQIPAWFDVMQLPGLSYETREKIGRIRPSTVGQASRIPGVRPTDIALLIGHLRSARRD